MKKFEVLEDCIVEGTNVVPYGSERPNFHLFHSFAKEQIVFASNYDKSFIEVETEEGSFEDGSPFQGDCVFYIPRNLVRLMDTEDLPPAPPEAPEPPTAVPQAPVEITVINGQTEPSVPKTHSENTTTTSFAEVDDSQAIEEAGTRGALIVMVVFVLAIIWVFLANC